ncbi:CLK4-associating serine/arginine rich protein [Stomoxys calcitrans]|uniref:CLK4-associating serine/arginine rich protein n=1 Tax=Stomoxys calcitrans TaxID=35570 RepID=UPI0027E3522B|nr:CLK4-associating serine/arginine rich protein [Stomoxys calcitrans]
MKRVGALAPRPISPNETTNYENHCVYSMSSSGGPQRVRRDEFDIESRDYYEDSPRRGGSGKGSRSSRSRHRDDRDSRSRSRSDSIERHRGGGHRRGGRYNSRSRSRSRSRGYSSRRRLDSGSRHSARSHRYRDSRSRSYSGSRSRSPGYNRRHHHSDRDKEHRRRSSKSRSRSRSSSSSYSREYSTKKIEEGTRKSERKELRAIREDNGDGEDNSSSSQGLHDKSLKDLPLPEQEEGSTSKKALYKFDEDEPIDRARIHREMEEKLRQALAKEGKVYPPPKPEASHPVFANDGSFLEIFKKMQEQQMQPKPSTSTAAARPVVAAVNPAVPVLAAATVNPTTAPYLVATATGKSAPPPPIVGRRKGGKILKTGVVAKPKANAEPSNDPKDFWSLYLAEVNKYKNTACESEQGNRPLIK